MPQIVMLPETWQTMSDTSARETSWLTLRMTKAQNMLTMK